MEDIHVIYYQMDCPAAVGDPGHELQTGQIIGTVEHAYSAILTFFRPTPQRRVQVRRTQSRG
jgi:hypothetical protein